jgi:hypothetical protein
MFINDDKSNAHYTSFEIAATKRLSNRWQLMASYAATKSHVPYISDISGNKVVQGLTSYNPNAEINAANNTWEWQTRLSGSYLFPGDIGTDRAVARRGRTARMAAESAEPLFWLDHGARCTIRPTSSPLSWCSRTPSTCCSAGRGGIPTRLASVHSPSSSASIYSSGLSRTGFTFNS